MSIRLKIVLLVLPLMITTASLVGIASYFAASAGINRITRDFLGFKANELEKYAQSQWQLLVENDRADKPEWIQAHIGGVEAYAKSLVLGQSELIFALKSDGGLSESDSRLDSFTQSEREALAAQLRAGTQRLVNFGFAGEARVGKAFYFAPHDWYYVVSDLASQFYSDIYQIAWQTALILGLSLGASVVLLLFFANKISRPLRTIADTMKDIIASGDLSKSVRVEYADETGTLAHTFNIMTGELDSAWKQIKNYALQAVLAQKNEAKIRRIFQKFVPQEVIDRFEANPEAMLVGEDRMLSILFSDIRSFTTISESMRPADLVQSLNHYFSVMVDLILNRKGVVDKYIGDAIMAFFGAPVKHEDDGLQSVLAGIDMIEALVSFNKSQLAKGRPEFHIGVGINFGIVTVGNIGTDKKMDYTVIGDTVNLASRMEGLTKEYKQELLISESLNDIVAGTLPTRLIDTVAVKGKTKGVRIYTAKTSLSASEREGWNYHNDAMEAYFSRNFVRALELFAKAEASLGKDFAIDIIKEECQRLAKNPPPADWNGVRKMDHK